MISYATMPDPTLHRDRNSLIQNFTLRISSFGYWFISFNILHNRLVIQWVSRFLEFYELLQQINQTLWGNHRNLQSVPRWSEIWVTMWAYNWHLNSRAVLWGWAPKLWNLMLSPGTIYLTLFVRIALNCRSPSWCLRFTCWWGNLSSLHTHTHWNCFRIVRPL